MPTNSIQALSNHWPTVEETVPLVPLAPKFSQLHSILAPTLLHSLLSQKQTPSLRLMLYLFEINLNIKPKFEETSSTFATPVKADPFPNFQIPPRDPNQSQSIAQSQVFNPTPSQSTYQQLNNLNPILSKLGNFPTNSTSNLSSVWDH
jgi:hypothetical protein